MIDRRPLPPVSTGVGLCPMVEVTFSFQARPDLHEACVVGDFNRWRQGDTPMFLEGGRFVARVELPTGERVRFKYLINGSRWENDWAADDYEPNEHGGDDSVIDLTEPPSRAASSTSTSEPTPPPSAGPPPTTLAS